MRRLLSVSFLSILIGTSVFSVDSSAESRPAIAPDFGSEAIDGGQDELTGDEYIVRFVDGADADVETHRLQANGIAVVATFHDVFPGASVTASAVEASALRADPRVALLTRDMQLQSEDADEFGAATVQTNPPWGLDRIDQRDRPLSGTYGASGTGAGVTVYILDSGIRGDHVDFGGRVGPGAYIERLGPEDCEGHGTHVAGTAGGTTYGVAKGVTLVPVKVLDCDGFATGSDVVTGLDWIIADHQAGQPAVLNASIGGQANSFVDGVFQDVIDDGITVVVAAGNDGVPACSQSPGRLPAAVTVAATNINDFSPNFSNYGSCVDVFAPGVDVISSSNTSPTATATHNGTSMASPHVAGAAALILERSPSLTPAQVAAQIVADATIGAVDNEGTGSPNRLLYVADVAVPTFVSILPSRLLETRPGLSTVDGQFLGQGVVPASGIVELAVGGRAGVPANATAAVLNVTVVEPTAAGFVTVFPCGSGVPNSSSVNFVAHATVANAVVSKLGTQGRVCLFTNVATHLVVDVNGYFPAGSSFVSVLPARVLETRPGLPTVDGLFAGQGVVPSGDVVELTVAGRAGVGGDASAVVLNVTVVGSAAAGYVNVFPCGTGVPNSSSVNFAAGATVANAVVSKVGVGGQVCVFTNVAADLIVDVNGYFPAGSSFTSVLPARLLETRPGLPTVDGLSAGQGLVPAGGIVQLPVVNRGGVAPNASAVVLNVTVVEPAAAGFVTVFPCGNSVPNSSSVNFAAGATVANAVVSQVGAGGLVCLYTNVAAHLLTDVNGYFVA